MKKNASQCAVEGAPPALSPSIRVLQGSPSRLHRRLSGDLDSIVLKALRKEPSRRYASIEQFAEDIRRHLDGLPVAATKGSWSYRAGKFIRRHKMGMIFSAVVLIAVLGGVAATIREARIAAANERRAERRFNDVRKLANSFLFEFHDSIEHLQGSTPARELVVKRALEYLDSLSQEAGNDHSLRYELATAYEKVGAVQGSPYRDNLGNTKGALESFQKAIAILEQLVSASPQNQDLRSQLARDYGELGDMLDAGGDLKAAMDSYNKGLQALLSEPHPNLKTKIRTETIEDRFGLGLTESGDLIRAVASFENALTVIDQLIKEDPSDRDNLRDKAVTSIHLALCYQQMRRLPEALAAYRSAGSITQSLVQPGNAQSRRDVGIAQEGIADVLEKTGDGREALAIRLRYLNEDIAAVKADPSDALLHRDVYLDYYKVARAYYELNDVAAALRNQRKGVALNAAEVAGNPGSGLMRKDLEVDYFYLALILQKGKENVQALHYLEKARDLAESLSKEDPKDLGIRADLAEIEMNLGDVRLSFRDEKAALGEFRDSLMIAEAVAAANPANGESQILLARLYEKMGAYYAMQAARKGEQAVDREEALRWFRKSMDLWGQLRQHDALGSEYAAKPAELAQEISSATTNMTAQNK
jgi:eukaryotic-like serine/threonine-protein kinase